MGTFHEEDPAAELDALRRGDEATFEMLVGLYHAPLVRLAACYVSDHTVAEEVAQETWLAVLRGLHGFEGRSSLKTWIFSILTNRARTRGERDKRVVPFSALARDEAARDEPAMSPEHFQGPDGRYPRHWVSFPRDWDAPEERLLAAEMQGYVRTAIATLPPAQRAVIALRDVDGFSSQEICNLLGLTETNQRVLLHRARAKMRQALEGYMVKA